MVNSFAVRKIYNNTTPLCYLPDGCLICYHRGTVILIKDGKEKKRIHIAVNLRERLLGWSNMATRLLRFGCRAALALDNEHVVLSIGNSIHELDLNSGILSSGWQCGEGIRPLVFTEIKAIKGFENGIYFGGYLMNPNKKPVSVYYRIGVDNWKEIYTFPQGTVNHVHNVVADSYRNCLWIFTGDFDESAAIWKVTEGFKRVERVACNDQKYRACVVFAIPEGLLYATDAPFADDFIYLFNPETTDIQKINPIHGSCIFGSKWKDRYVFSTTVEGDGRDESVLEFLFGRKRGAGIKDEYAHLYIGNITEGFREIYKEKKDCMPFSFQFGVFRLPNGINDNDSLIIQPVATNKNDLKLIELL